MMSPEDTPPPPSRLSPGAVINDRYEIVGTLGSGGFAVVYRGQDREIARPVAIKVLNPQVLGSDPDKIKELFARFRREAQSAARIQHPGVVTIFDVGQIDPYMQPYIVMELLEGHDLEDEMDTGGPMAASRAIPLFLGALEALAEGHDLGIVHKDLKPSNLFLTRPDTRAESLRIVDFGIARLEEGGRITGTGQVLGTPQYLAPEYITEQTVSPALDVYQMGIILIEMLLGAPLIDEEIPWKCAMIHCSGALPIPPKLLDSPLGPVLERALHVDPAARYQHAGEFYEGLEAVEEKVLGALRRAEPLERAAPPTVAWTPGENPLGTVEVNLRTPTVQADGPPRGPTRRVDPRESLDDMIDDDWLRGHKSPAQRYGPIAIMVLLTLGVGWIAYGAYSGPEGPEPRVDAPIVEAPTPEKAAPEAPKDPKEAIAKAPEPEKAIPKAPEPIKVSVDFGPRKATVAVGGKPFKARPVTLTFASKDAAPIEVVVSHPGYTTRKLMIGPSSGKRGIFLDPAATRHVTKRDRPAKKAHKPPEKKSVDMPVVE